MKQVYTSNYNSWLSNTDGRRDEVEEVCSQARTCWADGGTGGRNSKLRKLLTDDSLLILGSFSVASVDSSSSVESVEVLVRIREVNQEQDRVMRWRSGRRSGRFALTTARDVSIMLHENTGTV